MPSQESQGARPGGGPPFCYDYPRPAVTADLAAFAREGGGLRVLLVRRKSEPFVGRWALPGGFLDLEESAEDGARRELREETGLDATGPIEPIGFFDKPGRDPRGRTITLAFATAIRGPLPRVTGSDDAAEAAWRPVEGLEPLAFDHDSILAAARDWLARRVRDGPAGLALLPETFDPREARSLFLAATGSTRGAAGWLRRLEAAGLVRRSSAGTFRIAEPRDGGGG